MLRPGPQDMQAIIFDRGRQYAVDTGDSVRLDRLDAQPGDELVFDKVLAVGSTIGTPYVDGALVKARVEEHGRGQKLHVIRFKRRKDYRRKTGHRQPYTRVTISSIEG